MFKDFIMQYGELLISTFVPIVGAYIGYVAKKVWTELEKRKVVKEVVSALEQIKKSKYKDKTPDEIKELAIGDISTILASKGIKITDIEIRILIESVVHGFNS